MMEYLIIRGIVCTKQNTQRDLLEAIIGIIAVRESKRSSNDQSVLHVKMRDDISPRNVVGRSLVCAAQR